MKKILFQSVILLVLLVAGCGHPDKKKDSKTYRTMVVSIGRDTVQQEYAAKLTGRQIVEIRPQVSGKITRICINEGAPVKKGQVLFIIDQVPYEAALKVAQANVRSAQSKLATAKLNLESYSNLQNNQIIGDYQVSAARNALQEAEADLQQAQAQLTNARNNLSYTVVKSPVSGVAGMIPYHVGALVSSSISDPLVTVTDDSEVYAYFSVTENQTLDMESQYGSIANFIKEAPTVQLQMSNGSAYPLAGHIDAISGIVDEGTGAVTLRSVFPNPERRLRNGASAKVVLSNVLDSCIIIPQSATYELQDKVFVYKVVDGKAQSTPVKVFHLNNGTQYLVQEGLQKGDVIVSEGAGLVKNGDEISTQKQ